MIRRPLNVAALLLLTLAGLLTLADYENLPSYPWSIGAGGWVVQAEWGVINVQRFAGGTVVAVPPPVPLGQLAIVLAFGALILNLAGVARARRRQARGFPIEPAQK